VNIHANPLNAGWDISSVQDWLGHKDIGDTEIYGKIQNERREVQPKKLLKSNEVANALSEI
jgi:site-specific recombinase XerD